MGKRVLVVTQWFDPEPAYRGSEFAQDLVDAGYDVEVVTGFPNYPGGKVYKGYTIRPIRRKTTQSGYQLTRLALYPNHGTSKIGRILNYISFLCSVFIYLTFWIRKVDLVYVYHPPATVAVAVAGAKFFRRWPMVVEIQDLWPDTLAATGMITNPRILSAIGYWTRWMYTRADHIIVQSWGFRNRIAAQGIGSEKITTLINWTNEDQVDVDLSDVPKFDPRHTMTVLFAGNMGPAQALSSVLDAAVQLQDRRNDIGFYFLGDGLDAPALKAKAEGLSNVTFWPRITPEKARCVLKTADALLVHLSDDPLFEITIPSKTQAYMLTGRPIIMAVAGDAARLVAECNGGAVVPPQDVLALCDAIEELADMPAAERDRLGQNARNHYDTHYSKAKGMSVFFAIFDELLLE